MRALGLVADGACVDSNDRGFLDGFAGPEGLPPMWGGRLPDLDDCCEEGCLSLDHVHGGVDGGGDVVRFNAGF